MSEGSFKKYCLLGTHTDVAKIVNTNDMRTLSSC